MTFRYKDYRRNGQARYRTKTLSADEFIRRFLLHVLPKGFIASAITGCWRADNRRSQVLSRTARYSICASIKQLMYHSVNET
jgi:hypothetical protein